MSNQEVISKEHLKKPRCRCYINLKYYAEVVKTSRGTLRGYKPCPLHESEEK